MRSRCLPVWTGDRQYLSSRMCPRNHIPSLAVCESVRTSQPRATSCEQYRLLVISDSPWLLTSRARASSLMQTIDCRRRTERLAKISNLAVSDQSSGLADIFAFLGFPLTTANSHLRPPAKGQPPIRI